MRLQQSMKKWIKEGDANSRFFHGVVARQGRRNALMGVRIKGRWIEEVGEVKEGIRDYFESHFK